MKLWQLEPFHTIFDLYLPQTICEIGTHHGRSACQFIQYLAPRVDQLHYTGYDLFEDADPVTTKQEHNGKGPGSFDRARRSIKKILASHPNVSFDLIRGNTRHTLKPQNFDFVYIDGGHSYDTVMHDFLMVQGSRAIVFDDYQIPGVRQAVDEISQTNPDYMTIRLPARSERLKRNQVAIFWRPDRQLTTQLIDRLERAV